VDGVGYDVYPGETLGVVEESASGESVTVLAALGIIPQPPGRIVMGDVVFDSVDLLRLRAEELRAHPWQEVAMVFQDPLEETEGTPTAPG
jgi:oligopeptide transport system ATP-binding protein